MSASFILASASPRRLALLGQIGFAPTKVHPANIDETPLKAEQPRAYVMRVAADKARHVALSFPGEHILASDTTVCVGRRILPKAEDEQTARECLALLSGRAHRVLSAVVLVRADGTPVERLVETRVKVRHLSDAAIEEYINSGEWHGKAGGYAIQGLFAKHIVGLVGSYTGVVGLPLYETANLLESAGVRAQISSEEVGA